MENNELMHEMREVRATSEAKDERIHALETQLNQIIASQRTT